MVGDIIIDETEFLKMEKEDEKKAELHEMITETDIDNLVCQTIGFSKIHIASLYPDSYVIGQGLEWFFKNFEYEIYKTDDISIDNPSSLFLKLTFHIPMSGVWKFMEEMKKRR
jgi:hypothetical protein